MRFINPKTDYGFKKIFGSTQSKEILISFLNAILYQEKPIIQDLEILNPYSPGVTFDLKDTYLDVKARLDNQTTVLIEMQILNRYAFEKRVMYNASKTYANQLEVGERYFLLNPVIALTIVDFIMFENTQEIITNFVFQEVQEKFIYNEEVKLVFVELPKFKKALEDLTSLKEKWMFFIKNAAKLKEKPAKMEEVTELNQALEIANLSSLSLEELEEIQKRAVWLTDQEGIFIKGKVEGKIELIINLLTKRLGEIPSEISQKIAQLPVSEIDKLTEAILDINSLNELTNYVKIN